MPAGFTVTASDLHAGSGDLATDADDVGAARTAATSALAAAAASVPGGPLVGALGNLAEETGERFGAVAEAVSGAGTMLTANAQRYKSDDASAASAFGRPCPCERDGRGRRWHRWRPGGDRGRC